MRDRTQIWVGLDVHKDSISIAALRGQVERPVLEERLGHNERTLHERLKRLSRDGVVRVCYEAGGFGFVLQRKIVSWGYTCDVAAPSLIPRRPGHRVKTDRIDALELAKQNRAQNLAHVYVPTEEDERWRGLMRSRQALRRDVHRIQQRLLKLLQARGHFFRGAGGHWGGPFLRWLRDLPLAAQDRFLVTTYLGQREVVQQLMRGVEDRLQPLTTHERWAGPIARLQCLRGVDRLTACALVLEIVDIERFKGPAALMAWTGLGVSEFSSGENRVRGEITKAGNPEVRRLLIEAAWNNTHPPRIGARLRRHRIGPDPKVITHAWRAQQRLYGTWRRLAVKNPKIAVTAMARELAGFIFALWRAHPEDLEPRS